MTTRMLAAALAAATPLALAGCVSPVTVARCTLEALWRGGPGPQPADTRTVAAAAETAPVPDPCDAADDPAVWVNEDDPEASLIVASNKIRGLVVYGLDGAEVSSLDVGRVNNVDLRGGVDVGGAERIVVAATNRTNETLDVLALDPVTGVLTPLIDPIEPDFDDEPYGLCLYHRAVDGALFVIANDQGGMVEQWRLAPGGGGLTASRVRSWTLGGQTEGCVADDGNGWLYIGEENVGIWRFPADPDASPAARTAVDRTGLGDEPGAHLAADVEGLSLYAPPGGPEEGFLVASSQGNNTYVVYDRMPPNAYRGTFRVGDAAAGPGRPEAIDGAEDTDGLHIASLPVGPRYPRGLLVVQDGFNVAPDGSDVNQNFKLVSWGDVLDALGLPPSS